MGASVQSDPEAVRIPRAAEWSHSITHPDGNRDPLRLLRAVAGGVGPPLVGDERSPLLHGNAGVRLRRGGGDEGRGHKRNEVSLQLAAARELERWRGETADRQKNASRGGLLSSPLRRPRAPAVSAA